MTDPRWDIRPRQRGRHGVPGLHQPNRPVAREMAFDKLVVRVPGRLHSTLPDDPPASEDSLNEYRMVLRQRSQRSGGLWTSPGTTPARFYTRLSNGWGTIGRTSLNAQWSPENHELSLTFNVNPTRTLIHSLSQTGGGDYAGAYIDGMPFDEFFALSAVASSAQTLDGNDNAFDDLHDLVSRMGTDHAAAFIGIFERKLKLFALEAVAPQAAGFQHDVSGPRLVANNGVQRVALDWSNLLVRSVEVYCERRHHNAVALMHRLNSAVLAAHVEAHWEEFPIDQLGGRAAGSAVIGVKPTARIRQIFYAKTQNRVRIETQYKVRVKDNLRGVEISPLSPLRDIVLGLREDAARRLQWDSFCAMCEEPPRPMITDFARLAGIIAQCAAMAGVDPEPVFARLFGDGGVEETPPDGPFPRRLLKRLADHGLIERANLIRRARPGQPRRHHLTPAYHQVALMLQSTFRVPRESTDGEE